MAKDRIDPGGHARRAGRVDWSRVPLFPRGGEFPLARVWFVVRGRRYRATLSCVEGHIFDFGITPSPQGVAFAEWDSAPTTELLGDPLSTGDIAATTARLEAEATAAYSG